MINLADMRGRRLRLQPTARAVLGNKPLRGTLPDAELNQELLFKFLMSEIAAQRGDTRLAAQGYLDMAKSTRDPRLAKRATELAAYGRLQSQALEAARLWLELDKNNPQARQYLAALLVSSNKLSEAKPLRLGTRSHLSPRRGLGTVGRCTGRNLSSSSVKLRLSGTAAARSADACRDA